MTNFCGISAVSLSVLVSLLTGKFKGVISPLFCITWKIWKKYQNQRKSKIIFQVYLNLHSQQDSSKAKHKNLYGNLSWVWWNSKNVHKQPLKCTFLMKWCLCVVFWLFSSLPVNAILASFGVLVSLLLRTPNLAKMACAGRKTVRKQHTDITS